MKKGMQKLSIVIMAVFLSAVIIETDAFARAGGGKSSGSRGSRSYSQPSQSPSSNPSRPSPQQQAQSPVAPAQSPSGGFLRGMGGGILGGIMGGLIGGMLFRSLGFGAMGPGGYGGPGIFDILLIGLIGFVIWRIIKKRRESSAENRPYRLDQEPARYDPQPYAAPAPGFQDSGSSDLDRGIMNIRQMDASFDEGRFRDTVTDIFFRIQSAWMNRDLTPAADILAPDMRSSLQRDADMMRSERKTNRIENIAVRNVEITEAWQESGQDFITVLFYANLLDYTISDATGAIIEGSRTDPVKFEEFWTFTRPVGNNSWKLSAINQR